MTDVTIVGGEEAISKEIYAELSKSYTVDRVSGPTREKTAEEIAKRYFDKPTQAIVTNDGRVSYADALVGGYLGALINAPILLTGLNSLSTISNDYMTLYTDRAFVLGGTEVVAGTVVEQARKAVIDEREVKETTKLNRNYKSVKVTGDKIIVDLNEKTIGKLTVTSNNAIIKNGTIHNITVGEGVKEVTLEDIIDDGDGNHEFAGGGAESIILKGKTQLKSDINISSATPIQIRAENLDAGKGMTGTVSVNTETAVTIAAPVEQLEVKKPNKDIQIKAAVGKISAFADTKITIAKGVKTPKLEKAKGVKATAVDSAGKEQLFTEINKPEPTPPSGGSGSYNPPEEIAENKLNLSSYSVNTGEDKDITFRYKYEGKSNLDFYLLESKNGVLSPYRVDGKNVQLKDDGNQDNGDLLPNDAIYSAKVQIKEDEGNLELAVGVKSGSNWKIISTKENILVVNPLTEEEVKVLNKVSTKVQEIIKDTEMAPEKIKEKVLETLKENKEEIGQAEVSESGNSIWFTFKSGVLGAVTLESEAPASVLQTVSLFNMQPQSVAKSNDTSSNVSIGSPNAAIFTSAESKNAATLKSELADKSFIPKVFEGEDATVEEFKKMSEYGTLIFDTKGESLFKGDLTGDFKYLDEIFADENEKTIILTGEKVNDTSLEKYNADLKTGRLAIVDDYYAITSAFVKHYTTGQGKLMQNALVYANTNQSMHNEVMAQTFTDSGAQTYIGYKKAVAADELVSSIKDMLAGKTVKETIEYAEVFGNKDLVLTAEQKIINGSLETDLTGWVGDGHIDTITRLGSGNHPSWHTITPTQGDSMGIISSGVDSGALSGRQSWIYQTFTVPENMTNLKFDYNIASSEPMVFIGSGFDDKFKATIVEGAVVKEPSGDNEYVGPEDGQWAANYSLTAETEEERSSEDEIQTASLYNYEDWLEDTVDKNEKIIGFESINSSDWGQDYSDDRQRVDAIFPHGDDTTYMTGWKTVNYDVTEYQGKTITLKLQVWDLGDTAYPTAVLFDNVRLTKADYADVGIEGRTEVRIPRYDTNEYFYQAGKVDQDGDIQTGAIEIEKDDRGYDKPKRELTANIELKEEVQGVSIDKFGMLSVESTATAEEITIVVSDGEDNKQEMTVKLSKADPSVPRFIEIQGEYYIDIQEVGKIHTEKYEAMILDEYRREIPQEALGKYSLEWSLMEDIEGLSIDSESGVLTIDSKKLAEIETYPKVQVKLTELDIRAEIQPIIINSKAREIEVGEDLKKAIAQAKKGVDEEDSFTFTNEPTVSGLTITYTPSDLSDFTAPAEGNALATKDLARILGGLYRIDAGIEGIQFENSIYRWNSDGGLIGSNWQVDGDGETLVTTLAKKIDDKNYGPFSFIIKDTEVTLKIDLSELQ